MAWCVTENEGWRESQRYIAEKSRAADAEVADDLGRRPLQKQRQTHEKCLTREGVNYRKLLLFGEEHVAWGHAAATAFVQVQD